MDDTMKALVNAPLADPLKIYLPMGRRPGARGGKPVYEGEFAPEKLTSKQVRERRENAQGDKVASLLDYYGTTNVPCERIAEHLRLDVDLVRTAMRNRGRDI